MVMTMVTSSAEGAGREEFRPAAVRGFRVFGVTGRASRLRIRVQIALFIHHFWPVAVSC